MTIQCFYFPDDCKFNSEKSKENVGVLSSFIELTVSSFVLVLQSYAKYVENLLGFAKKVKLQRSFKSRFWPFFTS